MNVTRVASALHVYAGLFLAPPAALFAVSVFLINHSPVEPKSEGRHWEVSEVEIPAGVESLTGMERIQRLRPLLDRLGIRGEVGFIRYDAKTSRLVAPVTTALQEVQVELSLAERRASIEVREKSVWRGSVYLHKMPGPHLVNIRGNWAGIRFWRIIADGTVYLVLLTTLTGLWLWWALRPLRKLGLIWLTLGVAVSMGVIYALAG